MGDGISFQTRTALKKFEDNEKAARSPDLAASAPAAGDQSKFTTGGLQAPLSLAAQVRQAELLRKLRSNLY
jgi:hypothetical protein